MHLVAPSHNTKLVSFSQLPSSSYFCCSTNLPCHPSQESSTWLFFLSCYLLHLKLDLFIFPFLFQVGLILFCFWFALMQAQKPHFCSRRWRQQAIFQQQQLPAHPIRYPDHNVKQSRIKMPSMPSTPTSSIDTTTQETYQQHADPFCSKKKKERANVINKWDVHSCCSKYVISGSVQAIEGPYAHKLETCHIYSQPYWNIISKKYLTCKKHKFWLGIHGERYRRGSLLCHNQSVFSHAFYSWFLPFRFSFLSSLLFWLFVHCLTDGFGTMLWQQLEEGKKSPPKLKYNFFAAARYKISFYVGGGFITQVTPPLTTNYTI